MSEPWLDRKKLAEHYTCSVRSIELAMEEGLPSALVFGRKKFRLSEVEPWLIERGYIKDGDGKDLRRHVDSGCTLNQSNPDTKTAPAGNRGLTTGEDASNGC